MDSAGVPENLKKQLALAVRSIQWSYAIFWSISASQPGVLEWRNGYYNGDIKTRKTIQAVELNADQLGLQRTEQLRELYESLSAGESSPHARRPSAALSPEDLTDTEWYFLVCMSFVFNIGEGLPGRALVNGQPIWLCNAHYADSKVFSRSLLAKSASIQTVVCFPYLQGVVELGVTDLVLEDPGFIQHIQTSFLEIPYPIVSCKSSGAGGNVRNDNNFACAAVNPQRLQSKMVPVVGCEVLEMASPSGSNGCEPPNQPAEDSLMAEGVNWVASQVQSWQFLDDEFSNCVHHSVNSSDCVSQTFVDPGKVVSTSINGNAIDQAMQEVKECPHAKLTSLDPGSKDLHYQTVLSALLKTSHQLILGPQFHNCNHESSFVSWKKGGLMNGLIQRDSVPQKLLKKILFEVPRMNHNRSVESPEDTGTKDSLWRPEADEIASSHALSEKSRRDKLNERFIILKSIVPSFQKSDKISILDDTIEYLQELERKVEELESRREAPELEARTNVKSQHSAERTSDNYGNNNISNRKKLQVNKRKACDIDEMEPEMEYSAIKDSSTDDITVSINDKNVLIEIKCPWREGVLLEILDALSSLHLDSHSVKSSTIEGTLSLTIQSKYKGSTVASMGMIKRSLQRVAWKC
ncbi:transcription factor EGL1-like isoform X2 [Mangifera indica]|uniref:transcription factor EGL1-like isoform X2 n=1 Tax=Mangifera indica TaxID=29780 RepID=UPI001CFB1FBD|nr:transcription factor EGL1-like isoform X2 [Mangifera indica]